MEQMNYDGIDIKGNKYIFTEIQDFQKRHIGKQYKELTAIAPVNILNKENHTGSRQYWLFQCSCGNKICKTFSAVSSNQKAPDCGHSRVEKRTSQYIGKTYNNLTVIALDNEYKELNHIKSLNSYYKCQCKCGNFKTVRINALVSGEVKSCGCLKKEQDLQNLKHGITLIDLTGKKFGMLTVQERVINPNDLNDSYWKCICECGREKIARGSSLRAGTTSSCGCKIMSKGEAIIKQILETNNITFIFNEPWFKDLYTTNNGIGRYDFILFNEKLQPYRLIEFDGIQHFKDVEYFNQSASLKDRQKNDEIKNKYAINHNIPLIRIPYNKINEITFETIMNDTFLYKGE